MLVPYRYPMFDALRQAYRRPMRQFLVGLPVVLRILPVPVPVGTGSSSSIYPKVNVSLRTPYLNATCRSR